MSLLDRPVREDSSSAGTSPRITEEVFLETMSNVAATVTVVTTMAPDGTACGLTVSAFCSVSLDPPLVLVSVAGRSGTLEAIRQSRAFTVNFLGRGNEDEALVFATIDIDRFAKVASVPAELSGAGPILTDHVTAYFECQLTNEVEAGDHWILIGRVINGEQMAGDMPLVYHRRRFVELKLA